MITILDYGAGNLTSVRLAFERLGVAPYIITDATQYRGGRILFPGVGSAASGMEGLKARGFDKLFFGSSNKKGHRSLQRKPDRDLGAERAARTGDDGDLAFKSVTHVRYLFLFYVRLLITFFLFAAFDLIKRVLETDLFHVFAKQHACQPQLLLLVDLVEIGAEQTAEIIVPYKGKDTA